MDVIREWQLNDFLGDFINILKYTEDTFQKFREAINYLEHTFYRNAQLAFDKYILTISSYSIMDFQKSSKMITISANLNELDNYITDLKKQQLQKKS